MEQAKQCVLMSEGMGYLVGWKEQKGSKMDVTSFSTDKNRAKVFPSKASIKNFVKDNMTETVKNILKLSIREV